MCRGGVSGHASQGSAVPRPVQPATPSAGRPCETMQPVATVGPHSSGVGRPRRPECQIPFVPLKAPSSFINSCVTIVLNALSCRCWRQFAWTCCRTTRPRSCPAPLKGVSTPRMTMLIFECAGVGGGVPGHAVVPRGLGAVLLRRQCAAPAHHAACDAGWGADHHPQHFQPGAGSCRPRFYGLAVLAGLRITARNIFNLVHRLTR